MALDLPENVTQLASLEIAQVLNPDGDLGISYGFEGMSIHTAIGLVVAVLDRLQDEARYAWDSCPDCGHPWDEHQDEDESE
jgi:hypothetical protein